MNKRNVENHTPRELTVLGRVGGVDQFALVCDVIMIGIFLWNQLYYKMNMLFLIIPLVLVGIYLVMFGMVVEQYCFLDCSLEIRHTFKKTVRISYASVFNYEATSRDFFINIFQSNKVKVYYQQGRHKKVALCLPTDVMTFVETLRWNCPEFHDDTKEESKLDVFFNDKK